MSTHIRMGGGESFLKLGLLPAVFAIWGAIGCVVGESDGVGGNDDADDGGSGEGAAPALRIPPRPSVAATTGGPSGGTSGSAATTGASGTTSASGPTSSASSGGQVECDTSQTIPEVVAGCGERVCTATWNAFVACQATCGVFPSAACMQQNCFEETEAFSQCLSDCPEYIACDPCLLACGNLSACGVADLGQCYAICPSNAPDAVWACAATLTCEAVPLCQEMEDTP